MFTNALRQKGVTLIELVMFIVIIGVAAAGILLVMNTVTRHSADPLQRKQALAIAESLLEEVELMPMTYCDPNDPNAATATSTAGCTAGLSEDVTVGPVPAGETRGSNANPFDNVADYGGYTMNGITDILGNSIAGLGSYSANVALTRVGTAFIGGGAVAGDALRITVTVTAPDGSQVMLDGYRTRYAPNDLP
jgi:MSHA pilin protein MshD